jgi:hypothetical protein
MAKSSAILNFFSVLDMILDVTVIMYVVNLWCSAKSVGEDNYFAHYPFFFIRKVEVIDH